MRCPYCATEIADAAIVCPQCRRELYLFKPLLEQIAKLEGELAERAKSAQTDARRIGELEAQLAAARPAAAPEASTLSAASVEPAGYGYRVLKAAVGSLVLLILAHWVLLFVYDVRPLFLRIASMLIPLPFAFLLHAKHPARLSSSAAAGFGVAFAAVLGMLTVTASIDNVPVLPKDTRELREVLEYVASIGLAFLTGLFLAEAAAWHRQAKERPPKVIVLIAKALTPNDEGEFGIERAAKRVDKLVKASTPALTGAASVYAGIKALLDNLG